MSNLTLILHSLRIAIGLLLAWVGWGGTTGLVSYVMTLRLRDIGAFQLLSPVLLVLGFFLILKSLVEVLRSSRA